MPLRQPSADQNIWTVHGTVYRARAVHVYYTVRTTVMSAHITDDAAAVASVYFLT